MQKESHKSLHRKLNTLIALLVCSFLLTSICGCLDRKEQTVRGIIYGAKKEMAGFKDPLIAAINVFRDTEDSDRVVFEYRLSSLGDSQIDPNAITRPLLVTELKRSVGGDRKGLVELKELGISFIIRYNYSSDKLLKEFHIVADDLL